MTTLLQRLRTGLRWGLLLVPTLVLFPFALLTRALGRCGARGAAASLRWAGKIQALWARATLGILGVSIETGSPPEAGPPKLEPDAGVGPRPPCGPFLLVANHVSYLDILVLSALFPSRFVAKSEIAEWPLVGVLGRSVGTIFLRQRQRRDVVRVGAEMARTLRAGVSVSVFPEGAAFNGAQVQPFHASLLQPAVAQDLPCLPVALNYATPGCEWTPRVSVAWWGDMPLFAHLRRLIGLQRVIARVQWGAERHGDERKRLAADLRSDVAALHEPLADGPLPQVGPLPES